ncbi:MAG: enoyl-CoA hydratase-related protein, partial [Amylibacter sp.]
MLETLKITRGGGVVLVEINRPKQLNALNEKLLEEMIAELSPFDKDPTVGCFVLTGNEKAFAAGADIKEMQGKNYVDMAA